MAKCIVAKAPLTADRLREVLHYDPVTGVFTWRVRSNHRLRAGDVAGCVDGGYLNIGVDGQIYRAHRLAWLYVKDEWPSRDIDHRDTIKTNNIFTNLREITHKNNSENRKKANANNKTGLLGVSPRGNRFRAAIGVDGKVVRIGHFDTAEKAHKAYLEAKRKLHAGCTI